MMPVTSSAHSSALGRSSSTRIVMCLPDPMISLAATADVADSGTQERKRAFAFSGRRIRFTLERVWGQSSFFKACLAACSSASFLLLPSPCPKFFFPIMTDMKNLFLCGGPDSLSTL